jgi:hypothetical protein
MISRLSFIFPDIFKHGAGIPKTGSKTRTGTAGKLAAPRGAGNGAAKNHAGRLLVFIPLRRLALACGIFFHAPIKPGLSAARNSLA